jgi:hypothetical protein
MNRLALKEGQTQLANYDRSLLLRKTQAILW